MIEREPELFTALQKRSVDNIWKELIAGIGGSPEDADIDQVMSRLRTAKRKAHLTLSAGDLSGKWSLTDVTQRMTEFADTVASTALRASADSLDLPLDGLFIIALGKMGAHELNYSSDIDVAAFFKPDVFEGGRRGPADSARRVIQQMARILSDQTADGYVLRTDLRLRPDPSSTSVAVSTQMAELYYETVGQNWERMVWIKARACAGDIEAADDFIRVLSPFVWRQHLDYWAISDIHAIKGMINSSAGGPELETSSPDLKLGLGGIREIEFFAQTQQLIMGGRDPRLRVRDTVSAITELERAGIVSADNCREMVDSYEALRTIEHRVQMRQDEQTHVLPQDEERRASVAALCGVSNLGEFDGTVRRLRERVHSIYLELFGSESRGLDSAKMGNLVFTGVDPDPGTVSTLTSFGFSAPEELISRVSNWHRGHVPATRSPRGRELLTALLPGLLSDMAETGDPDEAFKRFQNFLERLSSGVHVLSMLLAEETLRKDLIATLALAPRLSETLGKQPQMIEALLAPEQSQSLSITSAQDFDDAMNVARRHFREASFRVGHGLLHGHIAARDAGISYSDLADKTIEAMASAAEFEVSRKLGSVPGDWSIVALGKLGGRALTASSDLDLMVIYDANDDPSAPEWFARFTKRLITALSAETAEGQLYEVDMRLRPSGRSGPVAVRLPSFERYHREQAWTWEHMALTRLRPVCDRGDLSVRVADLTCELLAEVPRRLELTSDILNMRKRLAREKPSKGLWDLKIGEGGLVDLEFILQRELLMLETECAATPRLPDAIAKLRQYGHFTSTEALDLGHAEFVLSALQQIQRLALSNDIAPDEITDGLKDRLSRAIGAPDFRSVELELRGVKHMVQKVRRERIGSVDNEVSIDL
ncbi:MAG: bifunctional [glutamine synthetase] adenylyltransferase/[glutamine synthetase]-adenylyl-L-tyrosine phosphorylase [Pseudomonadota bacterium]